MGYAAPTPSELFSDETDPTRLAQRHEQYLAALEKSAQAATGQAFVPGMGIVKQGQAEQLAERVDELTKAMAPDQLAAVQGQLDQLKAVQADLAKDWSINVPLSGGLVPYDLEAPAKMLVNRLTPLRNSIPRTRGQGTAVQFRRILGWDNSMMPGTTTRSPFMNSNTAQTSFGSLALRRGAKISYAADSKSVIYKEAGLSDQVNWQAQFASQGYQNIRQLSQTALLWASFGGEELAILMGRGSDTGYAGASATPSAPTVANAGSGGTIAAGTWSVKVAAKGGFGSSTSSSATTTTTSGSTSTITVTVADPATNAATPVGYDVYVGASGSEVYQTTIGRGAVTLTSLQTGTAAAPVADTSADVNGYDGFLTVLLDPTQSGYVGRGGAGTTSGVANGRLSSSNPGVEFQTAFAKLWGNVKADPDEIWLDATVKSNLGDLLKRNASNNYRLTIEGEGGSQHVLGAVVTGIQNQITNKMVDMQVHPYMPAGAAVIRSRTLPTPDSEVSNTSEIRNVQDFMSVDWPVIQHTYDQSTYWYGALVHYAPAWSGAIAGLLPSTAADS